MGKVWIVVVLLVIGVVGVVMVGTSKPDEAVAEQRFAQVLSDVDQGASLLDVRTPEEFGAGHFERATNFSLQAIEAGDLPEVDKASKLYLYCRSGNRSSQAATLLKNAGYTDVVDLGGLTDVEALGGKLTRL